MEILFALAINFVIALLFMKVGSKRRIGGGWAFVLSFFLGLIGWIIVLCSKKNCNADYFEIKKGENK